MVSIFTLDVHAALLGARYALLVDVLVAGERIDTWTFLLAENRGLRGLRVPARLVGQAVAQERAQVARVELRPRGVAIPAELDSRTAEKRPLGVALHRFRQVVAAAKPG